MAMSGQMPEPPATSSSGPAISVVPDEVSANGSTELELIADRKRIHQVRRDLAVVDPLDRKRELIGLVGR